MKKFLIPLLAVASFVFSACDTTPKYTITGNVEGEMTGYVYLLKYADGKADTLAMSPITDGKFNLSGSVTTTTDAYIVVAGKRSRSAIMLENAKYNAVLAPTNPLDTKIEGTPEQALFNQYASIRNEAAKIQSGLYKEYSEAQQEDNQDKMQEVRTKFDEAEAKAKAQEEEIIKANPDSYATAYMVASNMGRMDMEKLKASYDQLGSNAKNSNIGQQIAERIKKLSAVAIGQVAPDFTLDTPDGTPLSMHSIKAKVKVIDFWASWCGPCRAENPNVVKVYNEFHKKGLEILGVSLDNNREAWLKAIEDDKLTWLHVSDLKGWQSAASQLYAVSGIPHVVILDENNVIVAKNLRGEELRKKIVEMLK